MLYSDLPVFSFGSVAVCVLCSTVIPGSALWEGYLPTLYRSAMYFGLCFVYKAGRKPISREIKWNKIIIFVVLYPMCSLDPLRPHSTTIPSMSAKAATLLAVKDLASKRWPQHALVARGLGSPWPGVFLGLFLTSSWKAGASTSQTSLTCLERRLGNTLPILFWPANKEV